MLIRVLFLGLHVCQPLACDIDGRAFQTMRDRCCIPTCMLAMPDRVDRPLISFSRFPFTSRLESSRCRAKAGRNGFLLRKPALG